MNRTTVAIVALALFAGCAKPAAKASPATMPAAAATPAPMPASAPAYPYAKEIAAFEAEDKAHPMPADSIIFYGSSSIVKWKSLKEDFPNLPVVNRGFGGSQTDQALHYVDRVVIPNKPKTVVLYEGDNDLASGKTPQEIVNALNSLVAKIHAALPETKIYFLAIKPSPSRFKLLEQQTFTNAMIKKIAEADDNLDYIDIATPMMGADGHPKQELFGPDNLHMAPAGYVLWTSIVKPILEK